MGSHYIYGLYQIRRRYQFANTHAQDLDFNRDMQKNVQKNTMYILTVIRVDSLDKSRRFLFIN